MSDDPLVLVGEITAAHGIRGEVKMLPLMDTPQHLKKLPTVLFHWERAAINKTKPADLLLKVTGMRRHQNAFLLTLDGVIDRNSAETFPGAQVFVHRSQLPALEDDSYYEADLVGLAVLTENGKELGVIERVHFIPNANDVYETPVAMIPAIGDVVVSVDLAAGRVIVRDIPGLRKDDP